MLQTTDNATFSEYYKIAFRETFPYTQTGPHFVTGVIAFFQGHTTKAANFSETSL